MNVELDPIFRGVDQAYGSNEACISEDDETASRAEEKHAHSVASGDEGLLPWPHPY